MFKISDKVVCVKLFTYLDEWSAPDGLPIKGRVYVVRGIFKSKPHDGLMLVGLRGIRVSSGADEGFDYRGFRKLEDIKAENRKKQQEPQPV